MHAEAGLKEALQTRLGSVLGDRVAVDGIAPVSMGASKSIWRFTATPSSGEPMSLVLRADPVENQNPAAMALEAAVLRAAHGQQVRVPEVLDSGDGTGTIGSPYVIMTAVDGETLPQRILRHPATIERCSELTHELGQAIAGIHRISPDIPGLRSIDDVADFEAQYRAGAPSPAMELAWRWLHANRPSAHPPTVVHGDFRHGNIIVDKGHLAAVLDWELCHVGDPLEDLGWITTKAWRFGAAHPVGGFGDVDDLLDGYASVAGWRPERKDVLWWSIYGSVRWGIMCRRQAARHLEGDEESLELALIGRRFAENEHDVLIGLGLTEPHSPTDDQTRAATAPTMFETPTVDDLLEAAVSQLSSSREYRDRLLMSALNVVRREQAHAESLQSRLDEALSAAGFSSEEDLAAGIRSGVEISADVVEAVRRGVHGRLAVWNPKYLGYPAPDPDFRIAGLGEAFP